MGYEISELLKHTRKIKEYHYKAVVYNKYFTVDKWGTQTDAFFDSRVMGIQSESDTYLITSDAKKICREILDKYTSDGIKEDLYFEHFMSYPLSRQIIAEKNGVRMCDAVLTDYQLLIRVLQLAEKNFKQDLEHDEYRQAVLDICQTYGLVIWDDGVDDLLLLDSLPKNDNSFLPIAHVAAYGFEESHFRHVIDRLYERFLSWSYLFWHDLIAGEKMTRGERDEKKMEEECTRTIGSNILPTRVEICVSMRNGNPVPVYKSKTLFDALCAQMTDIILSGNDWVDGRSIYRCSNCSRDFIRSRSNATLCENCRTPAAKAKATRLKQKVKKGEQKNV